MKRICKRSAMSLVQVLVVIGIVNVLAGLLLPAILAARSYVDRQTCSHRLRAIGVAIYNYHDSFGNFPPARISDSRRTEHGFSPHARLLPYLGLDSLFETINFEAGVFVDGRANDLRAQQTVARTTVALFLCPSDCVRPPAGGNSYRGNIGAVTTTNSLDRRFQGPFAIAKFRRSRDITDGMSKTAFFSERSVGDFDEVNFSRDRDYWIAGLSIVERPADLVVELCGAAPVYPETHISTLGARWLHYGLVHTAYNHLMTPNSRSVDCTGGQDLMHKFGVVTARSGHPGGAFVLFGDGSCQFVDERIGTEIWRAIATRNGGEFGDL